MDARLKDLTEVRNSLRDLLDDWRPSKECNSKICPKIEGGMMNERREVPLCPACTACPEVEVVREAGEVRIGEAGNLAVLKKDAWNTLVDLIQSGRLARL